MLNISIQTKRKIKLAEKILTLNFMNYNALGNLNPLKSVETVKNW